MHFFFTFRSFNFNIIDVTNMGREINSETIATDEIMVIKPLSLLKSMFMCGTFMQRVVKEADDDLLSCRMKCCALSLDPEMQFYPCVEYANLCCHRLYQLDDAIQLLQRGHSVSVFSSVALFISFYVIALNV